MELDQLKGARFGRCGCLPTTFALAFAMASHSRLGSASILNFSDGDRHRSSLCHQDTSPLFPPIQNHVYPAMPNEIVRLVIAACNIWPDGAAGVSEGVMRLLGGSMMLHPTTPRSSYRCMPTTNLTMPGRTILWPRSCCIQVALRNMNVSEQDMAECVHKSELMTLLDKCLYDTWQRHVRNIMSVEWTEWTTISTEWANQDYHNAMDLFLENEFDRVRLDMTSYYCEDSLQITESVLKLSPAIRRAFFWMILVIVLTIDPIKDI